MVGTFCHHVRNSHIFRETFSVKFQNNIYKTIQNTSAGQIEKSFKPKTPMLNFPKCFGEITTTPFS